MKLRVVILLAVAITVLGASWIGAQYFGSRLFNIRTTSKGQDNSVNHDNSTSHVATVMVGVLASFGNGTRIWYNNTSVPDTWNFYNVTYFVTKGDVVASWNEGYRAHFVNKILGVGCVQSDIGCPGYWSLWVWNEAGSCWDYSAFGVDLLQVSTVKMVAWHFLYHDGSDPFKGRCG